MSKISDVVDPGTERLRHQIAVLDLKMDNVLETVAKLTRALENFAPGILDAQVAVERVTAGQGVCACGHHKGQHVPIPPPGQSGACQVCICLAFAPA